MSSSNNSPRPSLRPAEPSDHAFLYASYLNNRWFARDNETTLRKSTWMKIQHDRLEKILSTQPVLVACLSTDPDVILGYTFQDGSERFTYVKKDFRHPKFQITKILEEGSL